MRSSQAYASTLFPPDDTVICGVRLKALTLGHVFLLQKLGSPFLPEPGMPEPNLADLALGLLVCSGRWNQPFRSRWFRWKLALLAAWIQVRGTKEEGLIRLTLYIHAHTKLPPIWIVESRPDEKTSPTNVGLWHGVRLTLMGSQHLSREQVMDVPVCNALWDYTAECANSGRVQFVSDKEQEMQEQNKAMAGLSREQLIEMVERIEKGGVNR